MTGRLSSVSAMYIKRTILAIPLDLSYNIQIANTESSTCYL